MNNDSNDEEFTELEGEIVGRIGAAQQNQCDGCNGTGETVTCCGNSVAGATYKGATEWVCCGNPNRDVCSQCAATPPQEPQAPAQGADAPPSLRQQKLMDLADRIDHEELWRRPGLEHVDWPQDKRDRLDAGVHLRRYADLLQPGRWLVIPPTGPAQFSAKTLEAAYEMAAKHAGRAAPAPSVEAEPLSKDRIREIFMAHGFTVKDGQTDLRPYVYEAAYAMLTALKESQR